MLLPGLKPGIYFNLSEEVYHKDPALSRTDLVRLLDTPFSYWEYSVFNAARKRPSPGEEQEYGAAFHMQLFEPKRFEKTYRIVPVDKWDANKLILSLEDYERIVESIRVLKKGRDSNLFLSGGLPEVTIVFRDIETGMMFRTRHDYFTPVVTTDFKSAFTLADHHLKSAFERFGYDIQLYLYKLARKRIRQMLRAGEAHVYGDCDPEWFKKFMASEMDEFIFIFQRKTRPYPFQPLMPEDDTEDDGARRMYDAVKIYRKNYERYGEKEWPVCEGTVKRFSKFFGTRDNDTH